MTLSLNTSASNVYNIMFSPGVAANNSDSKKSIATGPDLQQGIQESKAAAEVGSNENFRAKLREINILV